MSEWIRPMQILRKCRKNYVSWNITWTSPTAKGSSTISCRNLILNSTGNLTKSRETNRPLRRKPAPEQDPRGYGRQIERIEFPASAIPKENALLRGVEP